MLRQVTDANFSLEVYCDRLDKAIQLLASIGVSQAVLTPQYGVSAGRQKFSVNFSVAL